MEGRDAVALGAGVGLWACAIPVVKFVGNFLKDGGDGHKAFIVVLGTLIAGVTTPITSYFLGWNTREARVRGIALALGAAQVTDGLVHIFLNDFYSAHPKAAQYSAGSIFFAAGLTGIASVFT